MNDEFDVTANIKIIEWIKVELLGAVTSLYRTLLKGVKASQDHILDCIAGIIILAYLLAKRLGLDFTSVDIKIQNKLRAGIAEEDEIEKVHGDLSSLLNYIKERKRV